MERPHRDFLINAIAPMGMLPGQLREIGIARAVEEFEVLAIEMVETAGTARPSEGTSTARTQH